MIAPELLGTKQVELETAAPALSRKAGSRQMRCRGICLSSRKLGLYLIVGLKCRPATDDHLACPLAAWISVSRWSAARS